MEHDAKVVFGPYLAPDCKVEVTHVGASEPDAAIEISGSIDGEKWFPIDPSPPIPVSVTLSPFGQFLLGLMLNPALPMGVDSNLQIDPGTGELKPLSVDSAP